MFFKMVNLNRHPHATMACFVNKYNQQIRPFLEEDDIETGSVGINDIWWRYNKCIETNGETFRGANIYAVVKYEEAVKLIHGLSEDKPAKTPRLIFLMINRDVAELDFLLSDDPIYKSKRDRGMEN